MRGVPSGSGDSGRAVRACSTGRVGVDRPQLLVAEGFTLATPADPYLSLKALATYSSCSVRWLRAQLSDPHAPLPYYRLPGGKILVRRSEFDGWLARYRQVGRPDVTAVVDDVLRSLAR
jgi:hypothetical protein